MMRLMCIKVDSCRDPGCCRLQAQAAEVPEEHLGSYDSKGWCQHAGENTITNDMIHTMPQPYLVTATLGAMLGNVALLMA